MRSKSLVFTGLALVSFLLVAGIGLGGCSDTVPAANTTPSPTLLHTKAGEAVLTCAAMSPVSTTLWLARSAKAESRLDDYATLVNSIRFQIRSIVSRDEIGLQTELNTLLQELSATPPTVPGAEFDPDGAPFSPALQTIVETCLENGTPIGIAAGSDSGG